MTPVNYNEAFNKMSEYLDIFIETVKSKNSQLMATDKWTVKDVLCHIVFWHTNYAANYKALSLYQPPPLLNGPGYKLNEEGVIHFRKYSITELISMLYKAQHSLYHSILVNKVPQMTYKKNGHVYETQKFLYLIGRHLHTHTIQVKRAKQRGYNKSFKG